MTRTVTSAVLAAALFLTAASASAQAPIERSTLMRSRYAAGIVAGASQFDLSGTGTTALVGARIEAEVRRWLVAEGALGFFRPNEQIGGRSLYTVPEAQLQIQFPGRLMRPYVGAGGGYVVGSGGRRTRGTASGSGGLRFAVPGSALDVRAELRVRGIGRVFSGSTAEWTFGLGRRF